MRAKLQAEHACRWCAHDVERGARRRALEEQGALEAWSERTDMDMTEQ